MHTVCSDCGKTCREVGMLKRLGSKGCISKRYCKKCAHKRFMWIK
jgi:hypothetical protein